MAEHDSDRAWDEYEWERFLQQQDQKTEKYMELLEKYIDDPNRDEIVAREMGWSHLRSTTAASEWQDDEFETGDEEEVTSGRGADDPMAPKVSSSTCSIALPLT